MDTVRGMSFPFRIDPSSGGVAVSHGGRKLRDNLTYLLQVEIGERLLRRDYGAGLGALVHESINEPFLALIKSQIARAVIRHEPRIEIADLRVGRGRDTGQVEVELIYVVRATQTPERLSIALAHSGANSGRGAAP